MIVLYVILLAVIQGITEFLPVSSFGHLCIIENFLGMDHGPGVLLEAMLHFGTLAAVLFTFQKDIRHILYETLDILMDLVGNASLFIHNKRTGSHLRYARIVNTTYRKFTVLIWISMIPTVCIGYTARRLVALTAVSKLVPGAGMLITGIILLVIDLSRAECWQKDCKGCQLFQCHVDWNLSGACCISGAFQKWDDHQCRSYEWIQLQLCCKILLILCQFLPLQGH